MSTIEYVAIQASDPTAAEVFYKEAFDLGDTVRVRESQEPSSGFRGFTLSLLVGQPSTVDTLVDSALAAGAVSIKPPDRSMWGYGGVVQAPDGTIWQVASSSKKETGPPTRQVDEVALLLGVEDVKASRRFYVERGLKAAKSFGSKYVQFDGAGSAVTLALYGRRAAAKAAGVSPEGSGAHRVVIGGAGTFVDPDGFLWESRSA